MIARLIILMGAGLCAGRAVMAPNPSVALYFVVAAIILFCIAIR